MWQTLNLNLSAGRHTDPHLIVIDRGRLKKKARKLDVCLPGQLLNLGFMSHGDDSTSTNHDSVGTMIRWSRNQEGPCLHGPHPDAS